MLSQTKEVPFPTSLSRPGSWSGRGNFPLPSKIWNTKTSTALSRENQLKTIIKRKKRRNRAGERKNKKPRRLLRERKRGRNGDQREECLHILTDFRGKVKNILCTTFSLCVCRLECQSFISGGELFLPVLPSFKGIAKGLCLQCTWHDSTVPCSSLH